LLETCSNPPPLAPARGGARRGGGPAPAPAPVPASEPVSDAIPGVIAAGQTWTLRFSTPGNNADGIIATADGGVMVAGNDDRNIVEIGPDDSVTVRYTGTNTGGAVSRSKTGELFLAERGFNPAITQIEPERRIHANRFNGEPLDCLGGVMNDLAADSKGGVYFTYGGLFYADASGEITRYGENLQTNGIVLSPDEETLYVTNGPTLAAFDVEPDGSLSNQREFAQLRGPRGDGATIDAEGRLYVSTGAAVDVFSANGDYLGTIPGPDGLHGVAFSGPDKRTLYAIIYIGNGPNGPESQVVSIPALAHGYTGRAK
jgi:sugar lactone lactonase YvrE